MVYTSLSAISALLFLAFGTPSSIFAVAIPTVPRSLARSSTSITLPTPTPTLTTTTTNSDIHQRFNPIKIGEDAGKFVDKAYKHRKKLKKVKEAAENLSQSSGNSTRRRDTVKPSGSSNAESSSDIHRRFMNPLKVVEDAGKGAEDVTKVVKDVGKVFDHSSGNSTRRDIDISV